MSDINKWLKIVARGLYENFEPGTTVQLGNQFGGGVGKFLGYAADGTAIVDVKGHERNLPLEALQNPIEEFIDPYDGNPEDQRYAEIDSGEHYLPDKPELQPGDMVRIDDLYGSGVGEGFGVFVAYSTDGNSAICNVDSQDRSFPIDLVTVAPEEEESDTFHNTGNDGSMSPMTLGTENPTVIIDIKESEMDDFEKWMKVVNEGSKEKVVQKKIVAESTCSCRQYDCDTCFPSALKERQKIADEEFDLVLNLNESEKYESAYDRLDEGVLGFAPIKDMTSNALVNEIGPVVKQLAKGAAGALGQAVANAALSKVGDKQKEIDELKGNNVQGDMSPMSKTDDAFDPNYMDEDEPDDLGGMEVDMDMAPEMGGEIDMTPTPDDMMVQPDDPGMDSGSDMVIQDNEDTSELVGKIAYMQDMGMSSSNRHYDVDRLNDLTAAILTKIYAQVMGEESVSDIGAGTVMADADPMADQAGDQLVAPEPLMASEDNGAHLVDTDMVADLAQRLATGEIDFATFKSELDGLEHTAQSQYDGEMGHVPGYQSNADIESDREWAQQDAMDADAPDEHGEDEAYEREYNESFGDQSEDDFFENLTKKLAALEEDDGMKMNDILNEKKADQDYDKDGKVESEEEEHYGSVGNAIEDEDKDDKEDTKESVKAEPVTEACDPVVSDLLSKLFE